MKIKNIKRKCVYICITIVILILLSVFAMLSLNKNKIAENDIPKIPDKNKYDKESNILEVKPKSTISSVSIFMYHFILDDYGSYPDVENFLKPSTLEEQLKYITDNGYQTIFMNEIENLHKYTKPVALTFDDCFVYFYNNAFPLLKKYNQKATINIIVEYINGENYLTDEQIKEMLASGLITVESHTLTHKELTTISSEQERKEINKSKEKLNQMFNIEVTTLCYPVGDYNEDTIKVAKEEYKYAVAMTGGMYYSNKHDLYKIPRIYANRSMSLNEFISYLQKSSVKVEW